ncbi:MAG: CDP-glucose 4,6-dehydratase [Solirubrobacteraceae bacterium]
MASRLDLSFWRGRRVLLTGHSGFKGAWLALWLEQLGASVVGFSLPGEVSAPSLFQLARVGEALRGEVRGDVRDTDAVQQAFELAEPEIVIHMAAQSLVRPSFASPRETWETNVMGTVNVLEAVRDRRDVATLVVTSDKCYENREWEWGYREGEPLGGHDPYSSSKGACELVCASWRDSFSLKLASARAGNVVGGGDFASERLVPDLMRAALAGEPLLVRNPDAVRPWQHVLGPLSGYLLLAERVFAGECAAAWNFGPVEQDARPVRSVVEQLASRWEGLRWELDPGEHPHEAHFLKLDSSRAHTHLGWRPAWGFERALDATADWYRAHAVGEDVRAVALAQIEAYVSAAGG